jgi:hypothetical protein
MLIGIHNGRCPSMTNAAPKLPDGLYPFIDQRLPLSELAMIEAPADLERLLLEQAAKSGTIIARGVPVELQCQSPQYPDATFLVYWPLDDERLHMLAPKQFSKGRA